MIQVSQTQQTLAVVLCQHEDARGIALLVASQGWEVGTMLIFTGSFEQMAVQTSPGVVEVVE